MSSEILRLDLSRAAVATWSITDKRYRDWPIVYILDDNSRDSTRHGKLVDVYVGESHNAVARLRQHLSTPEKQHLKNVRVILDETFNKSVCQDLESYLIRMLAGDGAYRVLNRNDGIIEGDYYQRDFYRERFRGIWDQLGIFTRSIPDIMNSDLFKLSPFKALTEDQADSVEDIVKGLLANLARGVGPSTTVVQGDPGTGKTVLAIYMIKLLIDIKTFGSPEDPDNSRFAEFFTEDNRDLLRGLRIGLVVPQQSLRESIKKVFRKTPGLHPSMVMTPFEVGESQGQFDLLVVDETHRLSQRANQPSGVLNAKFPVINAALFGSDDIHKTQLDWIRAKSRHQILLLDAAQSVRPADLPTSLLTSLVSYSRAAGHYFRLHTQMRCVQAGSDYISYIRAFLDPRARAPPPRREFPTYDFRLFDDLGAMHTAILQRNAEVGLSRMVAGYAWEWKSKRQPQAFDIEVGGTRLRWNSTPTDWIASSKSIEEVGSIHTVQGYDLNYVGVIIGLDLRYNPQQKRLSVSRKAYFDKKGKENNPVLGLTYDDADLLRFVTQIYAVLLTRGVRGTYVYACDPGLREYLREFIPRPE
ncbi:hypothetical protein FB45DRAFT_939086 [Roridomyces roridus]|uniref:Schlafen group 3-like DNA/RNA helicase domain-containing protein n=1 Tax=Roridomyces roridus TaxID=1738132 RepID=A0AAD7B7Q4_9AGAR|nr:hypothetical protein FB45DRAFT_939086 [Roridomyces roridus]